MTTAPERPMTPAEADPDRRLRRRAEFNLLSRQDFAIHVAAYLSVNALLVAIWALTGGVFWPLVFIVVWGAGLALHARQVAVVARGHEDPVATEMERMRSGGTRS